MVTLVTVAVTTDEDGDFTQNTPHIEGRFLQMRYVPAVANLATGADLDIVGVTTGVVLANHDSIGTAAIERRYRAPIHDVAGAASLYAAAGEPVEDYIWVNEELTVTIANGGDTKAGTFYLWFG